MNHKITSFLFIIFSLSFIGNILAVDNTKIDYHRLVFENKTSLKKFVFFKEDRVVVKEYTGRARNAKIIDFDDDFVTFEMGFGKLYNYFFGEKILTIRYEEIKSLANKEYGAFWYFSEWRGILMFIFSVFSFGINLFYLLSLSIAVSTETVRHPFQKFNILLER